MRDITENIAEDAIAKKIVVKIVADDLQSYADFNYTLLNAEGEEIETETIKCEGEDYANWDNSNEYPYTFVSGKLGITIL